MQTTFMVSRHIKRRMRSHWLLEDGKMALPPGVPSGDWILANPSPQGKITIHYLFLVVNNLSGVTAGYLFSSLIPVIFQVMYD